MRSSLFGPEFKRQREEERLNRRRAEDIRNLLFQTCGAKRGDGWQCPIVPGHSLSLRIRVDPQGSPSVVCGLGCPDELLVVVLEALASMDLEELGDQGRADGGVPLSHRRGVAAAPADRGQQAFDFGEADGTSGVSERNGR